MGLTSVGTRTIRFAPYCGKTGPPCATGPKEPEAPQEADGQFRRKSSASLQSGVYQMHDPCIQEPAQSRSVFCPVVIVDAFRLLRLQANYRALAARVSTAVLAAAA